MSKQRLIIDCDPGQDDFINLMLAFAARDRFDIRAVTAVAGNVPLALTERNARLACDWAGIDDVPVHAGCAAPLLRPLATAEYVHGETGVDGLPAAVPRTPLADGHGVNAIVDILRESDAPTTLVATGPLTNIAMALRLAPESAARIDQIVLMGGAVREGGNITPSAEFNMAVDPHAAAIVADSGIPLAIFGLDVTHGFLMTRARRSRLRAMGTPLATVVADMLDFSSQHDKTRDASDGAPLHDPCTMLYLIAPELFHTRRCALAVEVDSSLTYGHTAVDFRGVTGRPMNARWADAIDDEAAFDCLVSYIARL